jgi:hypothetical protein
MGHENIEQFCDKKEKFLHLRNVFACSAAG